MPLTLVPQQDTEPTSLLERLQGVRFRYRALTILRGGSQLLSFLLVSTALAAFLDWRYHLPSLIRAFALVSILSLGGVFFYHWLLRPCRSAGGLLTMALRIETKFPELNDSLASAVQFFEVPEEETEQSSPLLRRETIERAHELCTDLNFNEAIRRKGTKRWIFFAFLLTGGAAWLVQSAPVPTKISLARLTRPYDAIPWPAKTHIEILEPQPVPTRLAHGETLEIKTRNSRSHSRSSKTCSVVGRGITSGANVFGSACRRRRQSLDLYLTNRWATPHSEFSLSDQSE